MSLAGSDAAPPIDVAYGHMTSQCFHIKSDSIKGSDNENVNIVYCVRENGCPFSYNKLSLYQQNGSLDTSFVSRSCKFSSITTLNLYALALFLN